jgi:4-amino-4-deoxychorismate lyase
VVIPGSGTPQPDDYGDGVFETLHLRDGHPWLRDEHLDRLARSAALLDLPLPPRPSLISLISRAAETRPSGEGALRLICRRDLTYYATVAAVPETARRERRDGIRLLTADLGVSVRRPPWSLSGAKTLSYAENLAARRWAATQGADDMVWLSIEGYALEAPTASLVWLTDDTLCTVPAERTGILPGTTAAHLLSVAGELGLTADERLIKRDELAASDGIWLASALRGLAEATSLDGSPRRRSPWTPRLLELLGFG